MKIIPKFQALLWIGRFVVTVLIAAVCSPEPSLFAKLLNFNAFLALQIATQRGRLQQIKHLNSQ